MPSHWCPAYVAAVEGEQLDRSKAFIGEPETICGLPVVPLTPFLWDVLIVTRSPYAIAGKVTFDAIAQFIWTITPTSNRCTKADLIPWIQATLISNEKLKWGASEIDAYLERTFLDAPFGAQSTPYYNLSASLVRRMAGEPYRWGMEQTLHAPFRVMFSLIKADQDAHGETLINRRSDTVTAYALDELNRRLRDGTLTRADIDKINGVETGGKSNAKR